MLRLDIRPGESVRIGDNITITLENKSGNRARIAFDAPRSVPIVKLGETKTHAQVLSEGIPSGAAA